MKKIIAVTFLISLSFSSSASASVHSDFQSLLHWFGLGGDMVVLGGTRPPPRKW